jgi:hypothetical protein
MVCTYQEDINLASADLPGARLRGENLKLWAEHQVWMKWGSKETNAVYLGWDNTGEKEKASYTLTLPEKGLDYSPDSSLVFAMADTGEDPPVEDSDKDSDKSSQKSEPSTSDQSRPKPIDCSLVVTDQTGASAVLPLSHFAALQPKIKVQVAKAAFMNPNADSEVVFQSFEFPLADFSKANPAFHPEKLHQLAFVFDRTPKGVVVLDNIGIRINR